MKKVLISGGSGLVGTRLTQKLINRGYTVHILSRKYKDIPGVKVFVWDVKDQKIDSKALEGVSSIIHLAGAGIAEKRWTRSRKKLIVSSRVDSAALLFSAVQKSKTQLDSFISASGINYYTSETTSHIFVENDHPAQDFLGYCCKEWEAAADKFAKRARVVKLRTGVVLSSEGGALPRMALPVKLGVGSALGSGKQYMPYIHIDDLCDMYIYALENDHIRGAYNACNGDHLTNVELTEALAYEFKKKIIFPKVPSFVLKLMFGEMANVILNGSRASADKIKQAGFDFTFQNIYQTLFDLYGTKTIGERF